MSAPKKKASTKPPSHIRGNQVMVSFAIPPEMRDTLKQLAKTTRVPAAAYCREALEDLFRKHAAAIAKGK